MLDSSSWPFVPFAVRFGISDNIEDHKGIRHRDLHRHLKDNTKCESALIKRCVCPGLEIARHGCCESATQEDRLCDSCRLFCYGMFLPDETMVRLVKGLGEYKWVSST